ncbi:DUF927 domain-containing protein [Bradyrhizobium septentrionale]|uniref:DUF927 domain-containing protein n=1 Tax=Bradyrhizobium septentrionale TaxID=1404411 RepID=A0A974A4H5_9BRAD|nr:DUF927 domain-containing protein [Bradyrhizobium septentrionale]UGY16793.1 DUF927 domain-containing protein [Bradyrhizobium septentrionale]
MTSAKGSINARSTTTHTPRLSQPKWSVRRFRFGTLTGPASVELSFPTEGGGISKIMVQQSELRHQKKFLDTLSNRLPVFPRNVGSSDKARFGFITNLVSAYAGPFELVPERTGFVDIGTFATYSEVIYADGRRQPIPALTSAIGRTFTDLRGTSRGSEKLLKLARHSSYLAFGIGVALAAALPSYIKLRRDQTGDEHNHLTETAVFNLSGRSSSGKTSLSLAAMSLGGSPERAGTLDFSRRGLAETASDSNDLMLVLDDTEKAEDGSSVLVKTLKSIVHTVPGGRSKRISRGVDQTKFPQLFWSTFGLSSSPRPISALAADCGWRMTPGDQVRLFNIQVPSSKKGGIFDLIKGGPEKRANRSIKLIAKLERGYQNHHGHIIPQWVHYLMAEDRSQRVLELVEEFIKQIDPKNEGWEIRFAYKFAYIYAAMMMGIESGILPWRQSLPSCAARRCYRRARRAVMTERDGFIEQAGRLDLLLKQKGRVVGYNGRTPVVLTGRCLAIRYRKSGRDKIGILDRALADFAGSSASKVKFTTAMSTLGLIGDGHGHAGTVQERIQIERQGTVSDRIRLWCIDERKLARLLERRFVSS